MVGEKIRAYHGKMSNEHHRYRSWEHCFRYFDGRSPEEILADRDHAALQLGFYLASWGMYRGSSFLLQHAYTSHLGVVDQLFSSQFIALRKLDFGTHADHCKLVRKCAISAHEAHRYAFLAMWLYVSINIPPMCHAHDDDQQLVIINLINDPIVACSDAPEI